MRQIRKFISVMLSVLLSCFAASAITSTEINDLLLQEGSLPLVWDLTPFQGENPTAVMESISETNTVLKLCPDGGGTHTYSFTFNTKTDAKTLMKWQDRSSFDVVKILLDDEEVFSHNYSTTWNSWEAVLPTSSAGSHEVKITLVEDSSWSQTCSIDELYVQQFRPLESLCVVEGSVPITFENDPEHPWFVDDNGVASSITPSPEISSELSFSFTVESPGYLSFMHSSTNYTTYRLELDGVSYYSRRYGSSWQNANWYVSPGRHTVTFVEEQYSEREAHSAMISEVYVRDTWDEVTVSTPGDLGAKLLLVAPDGDIKRIEMLRISGNLNSEDWTNLDKCTGIKLLDITNAPRESFPDGWRDQNTVLLAVWLPNNLTAISKRMFGGYDAVYDSDDRRNTIHYLNIPASVQTIGDEAFYFSNLRSLDFADDTKLVSIGSRAFSKTYITDFIVPETVKTLGNDVFRESDSLVSVLLPDDLSVIPRCAFYSCSSLKQCNIPRGITSIEGGAFYMTNVGVGFGSEFRLPEGIKTIGDYGYSKGSFQNAGINGTLILPESLTELRGNVFADNLNISRVELNTGITGWWDNTFTNCSIVEVVSPCPTPPSSDVTGASYESATIYIPDFAELAYKTDPNWYRYKNIVPSKEVATRESWLIQKPLRMGEHRFYGRPSVSMNVSSNIIISGTEQQNYDKFIFHVNPSYDTNVRGYLSDVATTDANELTQRLYMPANTWRFFSPAADVKMADITNATTDSWKIRYYDGAQRAAENSNSGNWKDVPADGVLKRGQGYIAIAAVDSWLYMPVEKANHDQFFAQPEWETGLDENPSEDEANAGWSYVGNPYPTYFDIANIELDAPITIWTGSTYKALSVTDDLYALQPLEGYFVQRPADVEGVKMLRSGRQVTSEVTVKHAPAKRQATGRDFINLQIMQPGDTVCADETRIVVNEAASKQYNARHDVAKFMSLNPEVAQIYTIDDNATQLAINERDYADGNVLLGVYTPKRGEQYEIAAVRLDCPAYLYDAITGIEQDLSKNPYPFISDTAGYSDRRFTIRLAPIATAVENVESIATTVTALKGAVIVRAAEGSHVSICNAAGQVVYQGAVAAAPLTVELPEGIYVVNVDGETYKKIVK